MLIKLNAVTKTREVKSAGCGVLNKKFDQVKNLKLVLMCSLKAQISLGNI